MGECEGGVVKVSVGVVDGRLWMGGCGWEVVDGRLWMGGCGWEVVDERLWMGGCG